MSTGSIIARTTEAATTVGTPHRLEIQAAKVRIVTYILLFLDFAYVLYNILALKFSFTYSSPGNSVQWLGVASLIS